MQRFPSPQGPNGPFLPNGGPLGPGGSHHIFLERGHDYGWFLLYAATDAVLVFLVVAGLLLVFGRLVHRPWGWGPRSGPGGRGGHGLGSPALDELELRYARGEVGRDEYLGRRGDLLAGGALRMWGAPAAAPPAPPPPAQPAPPPPPAG